MKTLTVADARKNLGKWLQAAARGEEIAIIAGADVIALRKVEIEATDYAWREYQVSPDEITAYEDRATDEHQAARQAGKLEYLTPAKLRVKCEKAARR